MLNVISINHRRKLAILSCVAVVLVLSWSGIIDTLSRDYVNTSTLQALAAYASARLVNAAVSVASSITFSAEIVVGFDIQPFQILDPINDLVEQYSTAMKIAISSLIVQKILVEAVSTLIFKIALTVLSLAFAASLYIRDGAHAFTLFRLFCLFAMIRFLIVLVILLNAWVDQAFVDQTISPQMQEVSGVANQLGDGTNGQQKGMSKDERQGLISMLAELEEQHVLTAESLARAKADGDEARRKVADAEERLDAMEDAMGTLDRLNVFSREEPYLQAQEQLEQYLTEAQKQSRLVDQLTRQVEDIDRDISNAEDLLAGKAVEQSWLASAQDKLNSFKNMAQWERIKASVEEIVPAILNLMAAFIFKTLILPLVFLALFLKGFRYIWGVDPRSWIRQEDRGLAEPESDLPERT